MKKFLKKHISDIILLIIISIFVALIFSYPDTGEKISQKELSEYVYP